MANPSQKDRPHQPATKQQVPDPATIYERAKPENEVGMGKLNVPPAALHETDDNPHVGVKNARDPQRQLNAEEETSLDPHKPKPSHAKIEEDKTGEAQPE